MAQQVSFTGFNQNTTTKNKNNKKWWNSNDKNKNSFNGKICTLTPIINVDKQDVSDGHDNEKLIGSIKFKKLYCFGNDKFGQSTWKDRANKSDILFYQNNQNGKIRTVVRDLQTGKLRLNQLVPSLDVCGFSVVKKNFYMWQAFDLSIAKESNWENSQFNVSLFGVKFNDENVANQFVEIFTNSAKNNAAIDK